MTALTSAYARGTGIAIDVGGSLHLRERRLGRPRNDFTRWLEPRSMAWAIPRSFGSVPPDHAPHVCTRRRAEGDGSGRITIRGDLRAVPFDDLASTPLHCANGLRLRPRKAVANHVVRIIDVLFEIVPEPTRQCLPAWVEELGPRIRAFENRVRHDD